MSYDGEICYDCGFPVRHFTGSYWLAPDKLWAEVVGRDDIVICPPCFTLRARECDIAVYWEAKAQ